MNKFYNRRTVFLILMLCLDPFNVAKLCSNRHVKISDLILHVYIQSYLLPFLPFAIYPLCLLKCSDHFVSIICRSR